MADLPAQGLASIGITVSVNGQELYYVQDIGDMGGSPETIDVTCFRNQRKVLIPGVQEADAWECTYLYSTAEDGDYRRLKAIQDEGTIVPVTVLIPGASGEPDVTFSNTGYVHTYVTSTKVSEGVLAKLVMHLQDDWTESYATEDAG
ncbi:MAG: hypothetical protein LUH36_08510 [Oscillospiraceae bacterium]|nr:hypothetical protein [Oscillospiraceae bacterium]